MSTWNAVKRREFLKQSSAAALMAGPVAFMQTSNKSGSRPPVVGNGEHTYECVHDWLVPPAGLVWGDTHGLCQDASGLIYVAHTVNKSSMRDEAVVVFDRKGNFIRGFGAEFRGGAHGIDIRNEDGTEYLYHSDINRSKVEKTTLKGEIVWTHSYPVEDPAYSAKPIDFVPTNVAFAPDGGLYVGDGYGSSRMLRYSAEGKFLGEIGKPGHGEGEFDTPHGQYIDRRSGQPVLVIADRGNGRVQVFTPEGKFLRAVKDEQRLRMPCDFHTRGDWMVVPDLDSQVCILDKDYKVVAQLGDGKANNGKVGSRRGQTRAEFTPGQFITPHDAIFLDNGDILVAEWLPIGRITLLRKV